MLLVFLIRISVKSGGGNDIETGAVVEGKDSKNREPASIRTPGTNRRTTTFVNVLVDLETRRYTGFTLCDVVVGDAGVLGRVGHVHRADEQVAVCKDADALIFAGLVDLSTVPQPGDLMFLHREAGEPLEGSLADHGIRRHLDKPCNSPEF